jgi:cysteine-S-conjugate beta-lyase
MSKLVNVLLRLVGFGGSVLVLDVSILSSGLFLLETRVNCSLPCKMSHASIDPATRAERALPEDLIRLCVGIEDVHDLIQDLESAVRTPPLYIADYR